MTAKLERLPSDAAASEIVSVLRRDGAVIVENLIDDEVVARINAEVDPHVAAADPGMDHLNPAVAWFFGKETRHVAGMPGKSRAFATDVMIHPTLMAVCDEILLPACARYQLNLGHLIDKATDLVFSAHILIANDTDFEIVILHESRPNHRRGGFTCSI